MSHSTSIRAHFDGTYFVPDDPVDVATGEAVILNIQPVREEREKTSGPGFKFKSLEERKKAVHQIAGILQKLPELPLESLRRENLYADDNY